MLTGGEMVGATRQLSHTFILNMPAAC